MSKTSKSIQVGKRYSTSLPTDATAALLRGRLYYISKETQWRNHSLKVKVLVLQSCLILCDHMDWSLPGSFIHGILQARILEWVPISSSRGYSWPSNQTWVSCIAGRFFTLWVTREAHQLVQGMGNQKKYPEFGIWGCFWKIQLFSSVQLLSHFWLFVTPLTTAREASLSIINFRNLLRHMSIELVIPSNHLILCNPLLLLPSIFPSIRVFPSVLPMNTQDWSPLRWTGWISLQSKELLRVFSNTTVQKHQFFGTQLSL